MIFGFICTYLEHVYELNEVKLISQKLYVYFTLQVMKNTKKTGTCTCKNCTRTRPRWKSQPLYYLLARRDSTMGVQRWLIKYNNYRCSFHFYFSKCSSVSLKKQRKRKGIHELKCVFHDLHLVSFAGVSAKKQPLTVASK